MRVLLLLDRLSPPPDVAHGWVEALAQRHDCLLAVGHVHRDAIAACRSARLPGLRSIADEDVSNALDAIAGPFAPDAVVALRLLNAGALRWAAGRGGVVVVGDRRAFAPTRLAQEAEARSAALRDSGRAWCPACFETDPYFRKVRDAARERVAALRHARSVLVESVAMRDDLLSVDANASIAVLGGNVAVDVERAIAADASAHRPG